MSGMFALNKLWQKSNGAGIKTSLLYTALTGLFVSVIFFAVGGGRVQITPFSLVCAAAVAGLCLGYNLIGFKVFSIGSYSVYMMFLMLGGMLLPFIYGMLFLGDADGAGTVSLAARFTGVALLTLSLVLPCLGDKKDKKNSRLFIILLRHRLHPQRLRLDHLENPPDRDSQTNRRRDKLRSPHQRNKRHRQRRHPVLFVPERQKAARTREGFPVWKVILMPLVCGALNGSSYLCQLVAAASDMPASVQYPMITGGTSRSVGCCREGVLRGEAEQTLARGNSARVRGYISFPSLTKMPEVV